MKRCGSLCWTAQEEKCECICGGFMHGKGSQGRRDFMQRALGRIPRTLAEWSLAQPRLTALGRQTGAGETILPGKRLGA